MINIPLGNHADKQVTERTNLGYVNVWKTFHGSLDPAHWKAGGHKYNDPYGFCTSSDHGYDNAYLDACFIYEVFKMSSVYMGE